ncbi:MAG: zf-HC2 domain-containing protein [Clostridiaceae bacterium]|nr:zf-HC2 domain-containing protein [Clostridiaceae bacterium]
MNRITCDVAKDIMPLCVDGVCSENSKQLVEGHIKECATCKKLWDSYCNSSIPDEIKEDNGKTFKDLAFQVKKKNRRKTMFIVLGAISISIIMIICFGLIILGLFSLGNQSYTTIDISNYGIYEGHIDGEKEDLRGGLYVFPKKISGNAKDIEFLYSCRGVGFSINYQQFLKCTYSDEEYRAEIDRLKNIKCEINVRNGTVVNSIEYSNKKFNYPAYVTAYGSCKVYEYALCNEDTKTIVYVYLQTISNDKVAFRKEYLPMEYQNGKELLENDNLDNTNIYYYYLGNGVFKNFKD